MSSLRRLIILLATVLVAASGLSGPAASDPPATDRRAASADVAAAQGQGPTVRTAERFDLSPPLRSIRPIRPPARDQISLREFSARPLPRPGAGGAPRGPDPVLQRGRGAGGPSPALPAPIANFDGIDAATGNPGFLFILPPDPVGDIGPNHYVQMVNSAFAIYNRAGVRLFGPAQINSLWSGLGGACETQNDGDPIVQYDHLANRWLLSQFTATSPYHECIAISQTPDPTGAYFRYAFFQSNTMFHDYPKIGVWPDAYYMSTNLFDDDNFGFFAGAAAVAFERDRLLAGNPTARMVEFTRPAPFGGQLPSDLEGNTLPPAGSPNYFVEADDSIQGFPTDRLNIFKFHVDWTNPLSSTFTGPFAQNTAPFDSDMCVAGDPSRQCIPQMASPFRLDALSDRIMWRLSYRNFGTHEAMVMNHTVDIDGTDHAGIRWEEVRKSPSPSTDWAIHQQGTYAGDSVPNVDHRWMGSIAFDKDGNIGLAYSISGVTRFPSLAYVGRKASDPPGTMPQGEVIMFAGTGSQQFPIGRWGDYSSLNIDPTDDCTFWYTNEYYAVPVEGENASNWRTRIGSFKIPGCGAAATGADLTVTKVDSPDPVIVGTELTYRVTVTNQGPETAVGVTLTDVLPVSTTLVDVSPGAPTCTGATTIICTLGDLASGASVSVDIVVTPNQVGTITNTATALSTTLDPNLPNIASAATTVIPVPALTFGPATVVDAQRTEGEPLNFIDGDQMWQSGPWGTSTQQAWVHRSLDNGDQWNVTSPLGLRPDAPPGGGDSDVLVDDQDVAYFSDLELANVGVAVSNDGGNTWRDNPAGTINEAAVDRQWMAVDNGPTSTAADNTVFLTVRQLPTTISQVYSTPGSTGEGDPVGGLVYTNASTVPLTTAAGAPCGQLTFDPVNRNLFLPCVSGSAINVLRAHVNPSQRTGLAFSIVTTPASPGGLPGNFFPITSTDTAGNLYVTWTDANNRHVYYTWATTTNAGGVGAFAPVRQIDQPDANTNVFHWSKAGAPGMLAVAWYGSPTVSDPSAMASWFTDRVAATTAKWYGYASLITGANTGAPAFAQTRFTERPMHYGQICLAGLLCSADPEADRTMADFMALGVDSDGALRMIYNDTTNQHNGAQILETRQLKGRTVTGGILNRPIPTNDMDDVTGDAQSPHYSPTGAGANLPQFDFTNVTLSQPNPATLRVRMRMNSLASLAPPTGKPNGVWLTRFQALSVGEGEGQEAYRIFYVGAQSVNGAAMTFFAGSGTEADGNGVPGDGCRTSTPQLCKLIQYPAEVSATGSVNLAQNEITIEVPLQGGFGPNRPITRSAGLYDVTGFTFGRTPAPDDFYADIDATRSFDFPLGFVGGNVYNDLDGDGQKDPAEVGLPNVTVFADLDRNGFIDEGEPRSTTDASGAYGLSGLAGGQYRIDYIVPAGFVNTGTKPRTGALSPGGTATNINFFARQANAVISGTVYDDANGNGAADTGETGIPSVLVSATPGGSTVTDSNGNYSLTGLVAGNYSVDYTEPPGYANTGARPIAVSLDPGEVVPGVNFFAIGGCPGFASDPRNQVVGTPNDDTLTGTTGDDIICGLAGDDLLTGGDGADLLLAGPGADTLDAGPGVDRLAPGTGDDSVDGGTGTGPANIGDTVTYYDITGPDGVTVNLSLAAAQDTGPGGVDTIGGVESVTGTQQADTLSGSGGVNYLTGGLGQDILSGAGGNDVLQGLQGDDRVNGGMGIDTASFKFSPAGSVVNLSVIPRLRGETANASDGWGSQDTLLSIESISGSNVGNDDVTGSPTNDFLYGQGGDDTLRGEGGNDYLMGGPNGGTGDTLIGGEGTDVCRAGETNDPSCESISSRGPVIYPWMFSSDEAFLKAIAASSTRRPDQRLP